ncbi:hypothetical protein [Ramlibacter sp.]|uniref:hypothetical protein n=1 Tax=Ramlibacter sp. TaxID=1917967 RepID=UPI0018087AA8|nr:hypothetical protein [Ramlibacter sp.]MBA2675660.1 hypothetical protein [Ramlibacter sp.]
MRATKIQNPSAKVKGRPLMVMDVADWDQCLSDSGGVLRNRLEGWAREAKWQLLAFHKGHIVKRMDNGLMMEFADARSCLQAAFALGELAESAGPRANISKRLQLRTAAHLASYARGEDGIRGADVQLISALPALAQPGEVVVTAELRNRLADGLDADFEDLGDQPVQPPIRPMHLFRAHPRSADAPDWAAAAKHDLRPGLAVIPFASGLPEAAPWMIGELIAEGVIARLSRSIGVRVISRQSTSALRERGGLDMIERYLGATFVLTGSYCIRGKKLVVNAELAEARSHTLLWSGQLQRMVGDLFQEDSELLFQLAHAVAQALGNAQVSKPLTQPLPSLDSNLLLLASISMTHSDSVEMLQRARDTLTQLTVLHPKSALPKVWLGMWYALNVIKGKSDDAAGDTRRAREQAIRALEAEPENAIALALEGYIQCQLLGNPQKARSYLDASIEANPSEPLAWLFKSLYSTMWDSSSLSVTEAYFARSLSPVDPLRYFFDLLTGGALFADCEHEQAITYFNRSLKASKRHAPTLRMLLTAQAELGRIEEGKDTLGKLLAEVPGLTVSSYLATGSADSAIRQRTAKALRQLGLPEGGAAPAKEPTSQRPARSSRARTSGG